MYFIPPPGGLMSAKCHESCHYMPLRQPNQVTLPTVTSSAKLW